MNKIVTRSRSDGCTFQVHVQPRAKQSGIVGMIEGAVKIKVAAPPVDGAANEACLLFLSRLFRISRSNVALILGEHRRRKTVLVRGMAAKEVERVLTEAFLK